MKEMCSLSIAVKALRENERSVDVVASTDSVDRHDEVVDQSWQLDRYKANPVVLYGHNNRELPIGYASAVEVKDNALHATLRFVTMDANPLAEKVWQSLKQGSLRAVSVGFVPHSYRFEMRGDREVLVLAENELLEISVVPIPANPDALAEMRARALGNRGGSSMMRGVYLALGLNESASETEAVASVTKLRDLAREVGALTGRESPAESVGVLHAWKAAANQVEGLQAEVQVLRKEIDQRERNGIVEQARRDGKLSPAMATWAESQPIETLKGFLAVAPKLVGDAKPVVEPPPSPVAVAAANAASKSWEQLTPMEKHALHKSSPELFAQLRNEWKSRNGAS